MRREGPWAAQLDCQRVEKKENQSAAHWVLQWAEKLGRRTAGRREN